MESEIVRNAKAMGRDSKSELIKDINLTFDKIKSIEAEYKAKKESCQKFIEHLKSKLLSSSGLSEGDEVTLIIHEYRDDKIHCFTAAQEVNVFIKDIRYFQSNFGADNYLYPVLLKKKTAKTPINFNWSLSWTLKKGEEVILEHHVQECIIPGTYKDIESTRKAILKLQQLYA